MTFQQIYFAIQHLTPQQEQSDTRWKKIIFSPSWRWKWLNMIEFSFWQVGGNTFKLSCQKLKDQLTQAWVYQNLKETHYQSFHQNHSLLFLGWRPKERLQKTHAYSLSAELPLKIKSASEWMQWNKLCQANTVPFHTFRSACHRRECRENACCLSSTLTVSSERVSHLMSTQTVLTETEDKTFRLSRTVKAQFEEYASPGWSQMGKTRNFPYMLMDFSFWIICFLKMSN